MKKILVILFFGIVGVCSVNGQTFTFRCVCDYLTEADSNCDICTTTLQSRLFKGLLIYKDSVAYKWIEQPYTILQQFNALTFKELIPNAESIRIELTGTAFDSIEQFRDSVMCPCVGTPTVFIAGPGIVITGDTIAAVDTSATNEAWTASDNTDYELITNDTLFFIGAGATSVDFDTVANTITITTPAADGSETIVTAGTGISVTGSGTVGDPYIITNTGDLSNTNEIQTLSAADAGADAYSVDLSLGGGSIWLKELLGGLIDLSRNGDTIRFALSASFTDLNGIYGDGTAGSGSNTLPPGGSTVTIPGQGQPLSFSLGTTPGSVWTALYVTAPYSQDDAYSRYLVGKGPIDSLQIYGFDNGSVIRQEGGPLTLIGNTGVPLYVLFDSVQITTVPERTVLPYIYGSSASGWLNKITGTANGDLLVWSETNQRWEIQAGSGGGPTGSGTANRFAYWTGTSTLAADDDAVFDGADIGFGTTTLTGKVNINDGTQFVPFPLNAYGTASSSGGVVYGQLANTLNTSTTFFSLNEQADVNTVRAGLRRFGSSHASRANELDLVTIGSASVTISTNNTERFEVVNTGQTLIYNNLGAGFTSTTGLHSTLQTAGSFAGAYLETVGSPTIDGTKYQVTYTGSTNVSWTLPAASSCQGRVYWLFHANSSGVITLSSSISKGNGGNFNTLNPGEWARIVSNGSSWRGFKISSL